MVKRLAIIAILFLQISITKNDEQQTESTALPAYSEETLNFTVVEESPTGSVIGRIPSSSEDYSEWRLTSANPLILYNASTGELLINGNLDREQLPLERDSGKCLLQGLLLSQSKDGTRLIRVNVEVLDVNDNGPRIGNVEEKQLSLSILESAPMGSHFWLGTARDPDASENGTIAGAKIKLADTPEEMLFEVATNKNGDLSLTLLKPLDREKLSNYKGELQIWDAGNPRMESRILLNIRVLDVNDNAPEFERNRYEVVLPMKSPLQIRASDADEGENAKIRYKIIGQQWHQNALSIDKNTGELNWNGMHICPKESDQNCTLFVEAGDHGKPPLSARAILNVHEMKVENRSEKGQIKLNIRNLPTGQPFAIFDHDAPNGTVLSVLTVEIVNDGMESAEIGENLHIELQGIGSKHFRVEPIGNGRIGLLRLNRLASERIEGNAWDLMILVKFEEFETAHNLQIFIRPVNDTAPVPFPTIQTVHIGEDSPVGTFVARIEYRQKNSSFVTFHLESNEWAEHFEIHPIAGLLHLIRPLPKLKPGIAKREIIVPIELRNAPPWLAKSRADVRIEIFDVNDHAPVFLDCQIPTPSVCILSAHLPRDHPHNEPLLRPNVQDEDSGQNAKLRFSIRPFGGDSIEEIEHKFRVDPDNGEVFHVDNNFGEEQLLRFWLCADDKNVNNIGNHQTCALVEIFVEESTGNPPEFPKPQMAYLSLRHSQPVNSKLYQAIATDPDAEDRRKGLRYVLLESPMVGLFDLDHLSGWLRLAKPLSEFEVAVWKEIVLKIGAVDNANHTSPKLLEIHVRIVSDNAKIPSHFNQPEFIFKPSKEDVDCMDEEAILEALGLRDGQMIHQITVLFPSKALLWSNHTNKLCLKGKFAEESFLLVDLGQDGWIMVKILVRNRKEEIWTFVNAPKKLLVNLDEMAIGKAVHRFLVINQRNENLNGKMQFELKKAFPSNSARLPLWIHPKNGILYWTGTSELKSLFEEDHHYVVEAWNGTELKAKWQFLAVFSGHEYAENLYSPPPQHSFFIPNLDGHLRPGDTLAELKPSNSTNCQFHLLTNGKVEGLNWSANANGNEEDLIGIFPDGQIRLLGLPPNGMFKWKGQVLVQQKWMNKFWLNQTVNVSVYIESQPKYSISPFKCPDQMEIFEWSDKFPLGTVLGKLNAAKNCHLCQTRLIGAPNGLMVAEGSGKLMIRQQTPPESASFQFNYITTKLNGANKQKLEEVTCTAKVEFVKTETRKMEKNLRKNSQTLRNDSETFAPNLDEKEFMNSSMGSRNALGFGEQIQLLSSRGRQIPLAANATVGTVFTQISARPNPEIEHIFHFAPNFTLNFALNGSGGHFRICPITGRIILAEPLKFGTNASEKIILEVRAIEEWSMAKGSMQLEIQLINKNLTLEKLFPAQFKFFVPENSAIGEAIGQIPRDKRFGRLQILNANNSTLPFTIDENDGILRVSGRIDAEMNGFYFLKIAMQNDEEKHEEIGELQIFILDQDEFVPTLKGQKNMQIFVEENAKIGSKLFKLDFRDKDANAILLAEIDPFLTDQPELFIVDQQAGWLRLAGTLDRENLAEHDVHIRVWDGTPFSNVKVFSSSFELTIIVTDVNDNAPEFLPSSNPLEFYVEENAPIGSVFGTLRAEDPDLGENGTVAFRIVPESLPKGEFVVDSVFGYLMINSHLDREKQSSFHFLVQAFDQGNPRLVSEQEVTVKLLDQDDNPPELEQSELVLTIREDAPIGEVLTRLECRDLDEGTNGLCLFTIEQGNLNNYFYLAKTSGILTLTRTFMEAERIKLEFLLNISVRAFTGKWPMKQINVKILVLPANRSPFFEVAQQIPILIVGNTKIPAPFLLRQIRASDYDEGVNGTITYFLMSPFAQFKLDPQNGKLYINEFPTAPGQYWLQIVAKDGGKPALSAVLHLLVQFLPRKDRQLVITPPIHSAHLVENSTGKEEIIQFKIEENDSTRVHRFSIAQENCIYGSFMGNEFYGGFFEVDSVNGSLTVLGPLDAESCQLWHLQVRAFQMESMEIYDEEETPENVVDLFIWVDDVDEFEPEIRMQIGGADIFFPANAKPGHPILAFDVVDKDVDSGVVQFRVSGEDSAQFTVDQHGLLKLAGMPSPEKHEFSILLGTTSANSSANNLALHFYTADAELFPKFENSPHFIHLPMEPSAIYPVAKFHATFPANSSNNHQIFYSIAAGDPLDRFYLDPFNGQLFWINSNPSINLPEQLQIAATSAMGPYTTFMSVKLIPHPNMRKSELQLECQFTDGRRPFLRIEWPENEISDGPNGLAQIGVENTKGPFKYEFEENDQTDHFQIDQTTGKIHLIKELDRETLERIRLRILVKSDEGRQGKCILEINVLDKNDNPPRFGHILSLDLDESTAPGSVVYKMEVEDSDTRENARNSFSLLDAENGEEGKMFRLESNGQLILQSDYRLTIMAHDEEWQIQSAMHVHVLKSKQDRNVSLNPTNFTILMLQNEVESNETAVKIGTFPAGMDLQEFWLDPSRPDWIWALPSAHEIWADLKLAEMLGSNDNETIPLHYEFEEKFYTSQILLIFNKTMDNLNCRNEENFDSDNDKNIEIYQPRKLPKNSKIYSKIQSTTMPDFLRQKWHFRLSRHSRPGTIVGQIHMNGFHQELDNFHFVLDQTAAGLFLLDNFGELRLKRQVRSEDGILMEFMVVLMHREQQIKDEIQSCTVRVLFLDSMHAVPLFSQASYTVKLSSYPTTSELLHFDLNLPLGAKIDTEENKLNKNGKILTKLLCFPPKAPTSLSLCFNNSSTSEKEKILPKLAGQKFQLSLVLRDSIEQIRSRTTVHLEIEQNEQIVKQKFSMEPFWLAFIRENGGSGQNIFRLPNIEERKWQLEAKNYLFHLNKTTGIISTSHPLDHELRALYSMSIHSARQNQTKMLFIVVDDMKEGIQNVPAMQHIFIPTFHMDSEKENFEFSIKNDKISNCATEEWELNEVKTKLWPNCTLNLHFQLDSSNLPNETLKIGSKFELNLQKLQLDRLHPNFYVFLSGFSTLDSFAEILERIANNLQDLELLLPLYFADRTNSNGFPMLHNLLLAFRDRNQNLLPAGETVAILENFALKNSEQFGNIWNFRVEKISEEFFECSTNDEIEDDQENMEIEKNCLKEKLIECLQLEGAKQKRIVLQTPGKIWAPYAVKKSYLLASTKPENPSKNEILDIFIQQNYFEPVYTLTHDSSIHIKIGEYNNKFVNIQQISIQFATRRPRALLVYWQLDAGNEFISIDLLNGKIRLNFGNPQLKSVLLAENVNDGAWHELKVEFTKSQIKLLLGHCGADGKCTSCNNLNCQVKLPFNQQNGEWKITTNSTLSIGGIEQQMLLPSGRISSDTFHGCLRFINVNGFDLDLELPYVHPELKISIAANSRNPLQNGQCPLYSNIPLSQACQSPEAIAACGDGICVPDDEADPDSSGFFCVCTAQGCFEAASCAEVTHSISFNTDSSNPSSASEPISFQLSPLMKRRFSFLPLADNLLPNLTPSIEELLPCEEHKLAVENEDNVAKTAIQWMEMDFRASRGQEYDEGILFCANYSGGKWVVIELNSNGLQYTIYRIGQHSSIKPIVQIQINASAIWDTKWHRFGLEVCPHGKMIRLQLDGNKDLEKIAKNARERFFPQPMSDQLEQVWLGGCPLLKGSQNLNSLCLRRFIVNNQLQRINGNMSSLGRHKGFLELQTPHNLPQCSGDCAENNCQLTTAKIWQSQHTIIALLIVALSLAFVAIPLAILRQRRKRVLRGRQNNLSAPPKPQPMQRRRCQIAVVAPNSHEEMSISPNTSSAEYGGRQRPNSYNSQYSTLSKLEMPIYMAPLKRDSQCSLSNRQKLPSENGKDNGGFSNVGSRNSNISSSAGFSTSTASCLDLPGIEEEPPNNNFVQRRLSSLMEENNSNFYQDVLIDWGTTKNYENWPPVPGNMEDEEF